MAVKVTDTTFRDGHQSLLATRLKTTDMTPIAQDMDSIGFHSMEVWGGATFDVAMRFLYEDPWERLRTFKKLITKTPLQMLLRGQSLVGYRNYADDVVEAFIDRAGDVGIDIFRVFDALNDERNLERAATSVNQSGKHLQLTLCYSVTEEGSMGGSIYNLQYYLDKAKVFEDMGADSICIKDMAGLLSPYDAFELVSSLKNSLDIPLQLHTHYTSGMASMTVLKAIEAGVDVVDTCLAPLALRTAQPAIEPLIISLKGRDKDLGIDLDKIALVDDYMESVLQTYRPLLDTPNISVIDTKVLQHQIPGGMTTNLTAQLREAEATDRLSEVLDEIPVIRKELGYPPLVTPMSQMIGSQAVSNVLFGRYQMISNQIKDYVYGLYGRSPAKIDDSITKVILADYEKGNTPITERPGNLAEPEIEKSQEAIKELSENIDDILIYALYPTLGLNFLRIKYGVDPIPEEIKDISNPSDTGNVSDSNDSSAALHKSDKTKMFNVYVGEKCYLVEVDPVNSITGIRDQSTELVSPDKPKSNNVRRNNEVLAPLPGIVVKNIVKAGQKVNKGETITVLESMKMETSVPSPIDGTIKEIKHEPGSKVLKNDVLAILKT